MKKKKVEENPLFTKKGAWLWVLCAPAALVASACYESKKEVNKKKAKRHKRAVEYWDWLNGGGL